jgi:hypothetical protein
MRSLWPIRPTVDVAEAMIQVCLRVSPGRLSLFSQFAI